MTHEDVLAVGPDPTVLALDRRAGQPGPYAVDAAVNPSLSITAQAERAMASWPHRGEGGPRPPLGSGDTPVAPGALAGLPYPAAPPDRCVSRSPGSPARPQRQRDAQRGADAC